MSKRFIPALAVALVTLAHAQPGPDQHMHTQHMQQQVPTDTTAPPDPRQAVSIPDELRVHMLANMRDHLAALQQIQAALADEAYDDAAAIAEQRLGMTSLQSHGAHRVGPYMPPAMRAIGSGMHRAASRFAVAAGDAAATGDVRPALAALAEVTRQCVACHSGYWVQ